MLGGLVAVNVWLFGAQRTALTRAARQLPFHPNLFLLVTVLVIFSGFFHELGHATATRYGGGSPGVMGVGIYLAWPAFYTDLTDSYRLNRAGRLRSDLGGVYFNAVLIVAAGSRLSHHRLRPAGRLHRRLPGHGHVPVPALHPAGRLLHHERPGRSAQPLRLPRAGAEEHVPTRSTPSPNARLHLLKRRARLAIKVWSVVTIAFLAFNFGGIAVLAPIIIPAEWASIHLAGPSHDHGLRQGNVAVGVNELVDLVIVAIAPVGLCAHRRHLAPAGIPGHQEVVADPPQGHCRPAPCCSPGCCCSRARG